MLGTNNGIGWDASKKKVVSKGLAPHMGSGGVIDALNNHVTRAGVGGSLWQIGGHTSQPVATQTAAGSGGGLGWRLGDTLIKPQPTQQPTTPTPAQPPQQQGFNYDPNSDPVYQQALARAKVNAQGASGDAMAALNKRGILDSTITSDRVAGIQQDAISGVETNLMPQLAQQAFQRYQDAEYQKNQKDQLAIQQGQLTGYYQSPEMQKQYDAVTQAKQDYANAKTPEERIAAHQRAETARGVLSQMNANAGLVGSNVTLDQAKANQGKYGVQTQDAIQNEWNRTHTENRDKVGDTQWQKTFDLNDKQTIAALTGHMPDGTLTTQEQQRQLDNLWTAAGQTGTIPDKLADMYGIPRGTKTQSAYQFAKGLSVDWYNSQTSRMNANNAQDQTLIDWTKLDASQTGGGANQYAGMSPNQLYTAISSNYTVQDPTTKKNRITSDPAQREQMFLDAVDASQGMSDAQVNQLLSTLGLSKDEISRFETKYSGK